MESLVPVENGLGLYAHDCAPAALDWAGFDPKKVTPTAAASSSHSLSKKRKKKEEEEEGEEKEKEKKKKKKEKKLGLGVSAPSLLAKVPDLITHFELSRTDAPRSWSARLKAADLAFRILEGKKAAKKKKK
ncbi:hypothetical protein FVER14953_20402 [Fusarium verticillioides]|nr:hypothetical protein FVER14953_20402 [Fusarium verticillioides]